MTGHCRGIDLIVRRGKTGKCYNIGGRNQWANIDPVRTLCGIMNDVRPRTTPHADLISFVDGRLGQDWRYAIDIRKIKTQLAWKPEESNDTGFRNTVD